MDQFDVSYGGRSRRDRTHILREQISAMTKAEAIERLNRYWTEGDEG